MKRLMVSVVTVLAVAATGCGSDADQARDTVKTYLAAVADGDGEKACDQLTGDARRDFISESGESDCAGAAHVASDQMSDSEKDELRHAKVSVETSGDAKKQAENASPGDLQELQDNAEFDAIAHVKGGTDVPLVKEDGDFKIAGIDVASAQLEDELFGP